MKRMLKYLNVIESERFMSSQWKKQLKTAPNKFRTTSTEEQLESSYLLILIMKVQDIPFPHYTKFKLT